MLYLVHFDKPYKHAQHYLGFTEDGESPEESVVRRADRHRAGRGSRLLQVVAEAGISFRVVRTWPGLTRDDERRMKRSGTRNPKRCPICNTKPRTAAKLYLPEWGMTKAEFDAWIAA
jgi:hypothetical protein